MASRDQKTFKVMGPSMLLSLSGSGSLLTVNRSCYEQMSHRKKQCGDGSKATSEFLRRAWEHGNALRATAVMPPEPESVALSQAFMCTIVGLSLGSINEVRGRKYLVLENRAVL